MIGDTRNGKSDGEKEAQVDFENLNMFKIFLTVPSVPNCS